MSKLTDLGERMAEAVIERRRTERVSFVISFDLYWDPTIPGARQHALDALRADLRDSFSPIPLSRSGASASFGSSGYQRHFNVRSA